MNDTVAVVAVPAKAKLEPSSERTGSMLDPATFRGIGTGVLAITGPTVCWQLQVTLRFNDTLAPTRLVGVKRLEE